MVHGSVKREKIDEHRALVHSRKLAEHGNFTRAVSRRYRDRGQRWENPDRARTNQIAGFVTLPSWKK